MTKVAVEDSLTPVRRELEAQGFHVLALDQAHDADAVVVSGQDDNLMNVQTAQTPAPVINAEGLTAEQVLEQIQHRLPS